MKHEVWEEKYEGSRERLLSQGFPAICLDMRMRGVPAAVETPQHCKAFNLPTPFGTKAFNAMIVARSPSRQAL